MMCAGGWFWHGVHRWVLLSALLAMFFAPLRQTARAATDLSMVRVAFTSYATAHAATYRPNVLLMDGTGAVVDAVTTLAAVPHLGDCSGTSYPSYSWSPDGRYLLLMRQRACRNDLLLLDQYGNLLRILLTGLEPGPFSPSWAVDGDAIAYVAATTSSGGGATRVEVRRLDLDGRSSPLWHYTANLFFENNAPEPSMARIEQEVGPAEVPVALQWNIGQHVAVCSTYLVGGLALVDTRSGSVRYRSAWYDPALSPGGTLAVSTLPNRGSAGGRSTSRVVIADPRTGAVLHTIGQGELPAWSPDGRTLSFERRTPGPTLHFHISTPTLVSDFGTYRTAIWQVQADGSGLRQLANLDAYGLGPLQSTPDGQALFFSVVENSWALWQHQPSGVSIYSDSPAWDRYFPRVSIERLDANGRLTTLVHDAGLPAVLHGL